MTTNLDPPTAAPEPFVDVTPATSSPAPPDPGVRQGVPSVRFIAAVGVVAFAVGILIGALGQHEAAAAPARPATPAACRDALAKGERVMSLENDALGYAATALVAVGDADTATIDEQTARVQDLTPLVQPAVADYRAAAAACRDGS
jgi:hypothetical protein